MSENKLLFVYGSLMCKEVMYSVTGKYFVHESCSLKDYQRSCIAGAEYPGIQRSLGKSVEGLLYHAVDEKSWRLLDDFEGEMYERVEVLVQIPGMPPKNAVAYVVREDFAHMLTDKEWSFDKFLKEGKKRFLQECLY